MCVSCVVHLLVCTCVHVCACACVHGACVRWQEEPRRRHSPWRGSALRAGRPGRTSAPAGSGASIWAVTPERVGARDPPSVRQSLPAAAHLRRVPPRSRLPCSRQTLPAPASPILLRASLRRPFPSILCAPRRLRHLRHLRHLGRLRQRRRRRRNAASWTDRDANKTRARPSEGGALSTAPHRPGLLSTLFLVNRIPPGCFLSILQTTPP